MDFFGNCTCHSVSRASVFPGLFVDPGSFGFMPKTLRLQLYSSPDSPGPSPGQAALQHLIFLACLLVLLILAKLCGVKGVPAEGLASFCPAVAKVRELLESLRQVSEPTAIRQNTVRDACIFNLSASDTLVPLCSSKATSRLPHRSYCNKERPENQKSRTA